MFTFSLGDLEEKSQQEAVEYPYRDWEEAYRNKWKWDRVGWGTHGIGCYPANCPYRVYIKDGKVLFEEQAGTLPIVEQGVPDMNPTGCQKGCFWGEVLEGGDRILHPLKRVGERGSGQWRQLSWDEAYTEIADAIIDTLQEYGPESILAPGPSCSTRANRGRFEFIGALGGLTTDIDGEVNDDPLGVFLTFGKIFAISSMDDWFQPDLHFIWHLNPYYTRIPYAHFIPEGRYKGSEIISIAPDFNPSAIHSDYFITVKPGTDAALALGMCNVLVSEGIYDVQFVKEQTDLPLLVRLDNRRYLRASDVVEGGQDDRFYFYDSKTGQVVQAPRGTLALGEVDPALEGTFTATLKDGSPVQVTTVFELLKEKLQEYTPEKASPMCGVHPDTIRMLARKMSGKTAIINTGYNVNKYYHGDLMERSLCLLLGLTGNWGKKGTGIRTWGTPGAGASMVSGLKTQPGQEQTQMMLQMFEQRLNAMKAEDPDMTDEIAMVDLASPGNRLASPPGDPMTAATARAGAGGGRMIPTFFLWYHHLGYHEIWNRREWSDPSMTRPFDDYVKEAVEKDWWRGVDAPNANQPPRVWIECGSNTARRLRGGQQALLRGAWSKLRLLLTLDVRMSATARLSDIVLPVAGQHEKQKGVSCVDPGWYVLDDKLLDPPEDVKDEWTIFRELAKKVEERAKERGFIEYKNSLGGSFRLDNLYSRLVRNEAFVDNEVWLDDNIRDTAIAGSLPPGTTLESIRQNGPVRVQKAGRDFMGLTLATEIKPDSTYTCWTNHVEHKQVYPTLTRRAQFYIDHPWFFEAGEELPCHKDPPKMGGDYPFMITSGHNRWSIHSTNIMNKRMLQTHRGKPHVIMNSAQAAERGIQDDEEVRLFNDYGEVMVYVKTSPAVRPNQLIIYNGWDPLQFRGLRGPNEVEPGMVKWLHLAGGYGHLRYNYGGWMPVHSDRATRVDVAKID